MRANEADVSRGQRVGQCPEQVVIGSVGVALLT